VVADPESIVICSGAAQAFALIARTLGDGARMAVEDPGLPLHRAILAAHGAQLVALGVDEHGARVAELERISEGGAIEVVLLTPAHQAPTGVVLSSARRAEVLSWARDGERVLVEDDYDAEYRYDRAPLGAMQGLAPDRVIYTGTVSKTLAPALRLGWLVLPSRLISRLVRHKLLSDHGSPTIDQLALARLLESGDYDRHLRQARRRYRSRRDALVAAVEEHLPGARVTGLAAGLHALVRLESPVNGHDLVRAAARESLGVYPLGLGYMQPRALDDGLVLGYANLAEPAIEEGIRRLARALTAPGPAATKDGGAIAR
jgi:GntR family transcriptional regulator/MocR family aminotransferase